MSEIGHWRARSWTNINRNRLHELNKVAIRWLITITTPFCSMAKFTNLKKILFIKNSPFISPWVISMTHSYLCRWGQENIQYRCSRYSVQGYLHLFDWRADPRIEGGDLSCFRKMTWLCHLVLNKIRSTYAKSHEGLALRQVSGIKLTFFLFLNNVRMLKLASHLCNFSQFDWFRRDAAVARSSRSRSCTFWS